MTPVDPLGPRTLTGRFIALEPLEERHHAELLRAAADPETWTYIPVDAQNGFAKRLPWMVGRMPKAASSPLSCAASPTALSSARAPISPSRRQTRRSRSALPGTRPTRAAVLRLGVKEEGTLRGHMWMPQGYFRDSVYFSILASEWPALRAGLEQRLATYA